MIFGPGFASLDKGEDAGEMEKPDALVVAQSCVRHLQNGMGGGCVDVFTEFV